MVTTALFEVRMRKTYFGRHYKIRKEQCSLWVRVTRRKNGRINKITWRSENIELQQTNQVFWYHLSGHKYSYFQFHSKISYILRKKLLSEYSLFLRTFEKLPSLEASDRFRCNSRGSWMKGQLITDATEIWMHLLRPVTYKPRITANQCILDMLFAIICKMFDNRFSLSALNFN